MPMETTLNHPHEISKLDNRITVVEQKVGSIDNSLTNLRGDVSNLDSKMSSRLDQIATKINEGQKPQWSLLLQGLGILLVLIGALFGLGVLPINQTLVRQDRDISALQTQLSRSDASNLSVAAFKDYAAQKENDKILFRAENSDNFKKRDEEIKTIKADQVPRKEHERVWLSYDRELDAIKIRISSESADIQRQMDEIKQNTASVYNQRDIIQQLIAGQEKLKDEVSKIKTTP